MLKIIFGVIYVLIGIFFSVETAVYGWLKYKDDGLEQLSFKVVFGLICFLEMVAWPIMIIVAAGITVGKKIYHEKDS